MDLQYEQMESRDNTLSGGGEMGRLMREQDWAMTPLGDVSHWPQSLRTTVSICLASRFPIIIFWGQQLRQFYNDAYRPVLGMNKHPHALGQRAEDCWPEIWDIVGPMLQGVLMTGDATWSENQLLLVDRNGYVEETYFTFSYSPIRDESGEVSGVFCAVTETTNEVLSARRLATLRALAANTAEERSAEDVCRVAINTLAHSHADLPFTQLYLLDSTGSTAHFVAQVGLVGEISPSLTTIDLADPDAAWPFARVVERGEQLVDLLAYSNELVATTNPVPKSAMILPIARTGEANPYGFLIAGINPRRSLDDDYRGFHSLVAGQIATAISSARTLQDVRERADALAELDRAKTTFFSNVSHEFRTPLTLLLGPLETLMTDTREPLSGTQRAQLEMARRNGLRQLKLVNTLLDFSRIEAGRAEAMYEPTDLSRFTIDLTIAFRSTIEQAGLRLLVEVAQLPEAVYVDRDMWEKIVLNLISNAFKFTLQGEIHIRLRAEDENVLLSVVDTGVGIDPQELPHLFERFYRAHPTQARTYEGSGIGLALVQELVRMHGGQITVTSQLGVGTTFIVSIPRGSLHLPADRLIDSRVLPPTSVGAEPYVEEAARWLPETEAREEKEDRVSSADSISLVTPLSPVVPPSSATRILVVDDNADMRDHLGRLLSSIYVVRSVSDGEAALRNARSWLPDLILTDLMMPGLSGFELLAALHADPRTRFIPVIVLSARAGEEAIVEGLQAGAADYLVKPFSVREVLARVHAQLEIARLRRESMDRVSTLEAILGAITDPLFIVDKEKNMRDMNRAARMLLNLPADTSLQLDGHLFELYDARGRLLPEDEWPQAAILNGATLQGASAVDVMMRTVEGRTLFLSVTGAPVYTDKGEISAAVLVCRDVTERQRMEEALRQSEERFRTAFTSARVGIALMDLHFHFIQANSAYCSITGYSEEELQGTDFLSITYPEDREDNRASIQKLLNGKTSGYVLQKRYLRKDGSIVWTQNSVSPIYDNEGRPYSLIAVSQDITEQREWAQRIQQAMETLLAMAEALVSVPDVLSMSDSFDGDDQDVHKEIRHLIQLTCDLLGSKVASISTVEPATLQLSPLVRVGSTAESDREWREQMPRMFLSDYIFPIDIAHFMAGEALLIDITYPVVPGSPTYGTRRALSAPLRIGEQLVGLLSTDYDSGTHKYPLEEEKALLRAIGKLIALMIERERLVRDRSEGLAREITLREVNRQTDEFISIISHELKSPLTTIKGNVQLARRQISKLLQGTPGELSDSLSMALRFLERAERHILVQTRLINDLLDVSRIHSNRLELHIENRDLVDIVRDAVDDQRQLAASRAIQFYNEEPEAIIMADADRVGQVLNNYLSNAIKYSDESKPVEIHLCREGPNVKVAIVDQGPGLTPEQQEHIWERFYRVPDVEVKSGSGVGLGLGLHICRTIIERQGGEVGVESKRGEGSTFWFTLPLAESTT